MSIYIDENCVSFLVGIKKGLSNEELILEAVKKAYSDMSRRTLFFSNNDYKGDNSKAIESKDSLKKDVSDLFVKNLNDVYRSLKKSNKRQEDYNEWHNQMCIEIIRIFTTTRKGHSAPPLESADILLSKAKTEDEKRDARKYGFSYGQAQKILNMTMKYLYIFINYYSSINVPNYSNYLIEFNDVFVPVLHTPVDSYVIEAAENEYYLSLPAPQLSWSQMDQGAYTGYQESLRNKCNVEYSTSEKYPFLWELINYPFK